MPLALRVAMRVAIQPDIAGHCRTLPDIAGHCWTLLDIAGQVAPTSAICRQERVTVDRAPPYPTV
jgi:hypothetical protein